MSRANGQLPYFDRFDICEAHAVFADLYNVGGDTPRHDAARLSRIGFRWGAGRDAGTLRALTLNGLAIYGRLAAREVGR